MNTKTWYHRNKEKAKERCKNYYLENKEKINTKRNEAYKLKSPEELEKLKEYKREYYKANKERAKELNKNRYKNKKDEILQYAKEYAKENYHLVRLAAVKRRALKNNIPFDLDLDYLKSLPLPSVCPVLGIPMDGRGKENHPSLDRIIPSLGYVKGNVCFISTRANLLKNDASLDEVKKILKYMESFKQF